MVWYGFEILTEVRFEAFFNKKLRVCYVYIEESFDTPFNMHINNCMEHHVARGLKINLITSFVRETT